LSFWNQFHRLHRLQAKTPTFVHHLASNSKPQTTRRAPGAARDRVQVLLNFGFQPPKQVTIFTTMHSQTLQGQFRCGSAGCTLAVLRPLETSGGAYFLHSTPARRRARCSCRLHGDESLTRCSCRLHGDESLARCSCRLHGDESLTRCSCRLDGDESLARCSCCLNGDESLARCSCCLHGDEFLACRDLTSLQSMGKLW